MKHKRQFKPKNAGCPQLILSGVKQKYLEAVGRPTKTTTQPEKVQTIGDNRTDGSLEPAIATKS